MEFSKKYRHIGCSYLGVPEPWKPIVMKALIDIEREMWKPRWLPFFIKRWIHYLATDNSVVRVKYRWAYNLRNYLTGGCIVMDVKDKYAGLRIYIHGTDKMYEIIEKAEQECAQTCEVCGSHDDVQYTDTGWIYLLCPKCLEKKKQQTKPV